MIFKSEIEKMAYEYANSICPDYQSKASMVAMTASGAWNGVHYGAKALQDLLLAKSGDEFDHREAFEEACKITDFDPVESNRVYGFKKGARWQHQKDQLIIAALREEIEWRKESYSDLDDINIKLNYKIQQLEQKIKELENGK